MTKSNSKRDLIIQAGIEAIPYVGGSLSTLYYGSKHEKRFERLEVFYAQIKNDVQSLKDSIPSMDGQNAEELGNLIEELNEKVEQETRESKVNYLRNFFINTLLNPLNDDFDQRKHFLDTLASMSLVECEILAFLYSQQQPVQIRQINKQGVSQYVIYSAVNKLRSYGYIESRRGSYQMNGQQDENLDDLVFISDFGKKFSDYIKIA